MVTTALDAVHMLEKEGLSGTLVNARFVNPLDEKYLRQVVKDSPHVITVEEGIVNGGFGCAVRDALRRQVVSLGLPAAFIPHGTRDELLDMYGLSPRRIVESVKDCVGRQRQKMRM
jgi:1-deoxy-D-xylulose-5-phosphate synthase